MTTDLPSHRRALPLPRRAVLVAPGSDAHKAAKALASSADEVVLDLEDAVAASAKDDARTAVADLLATHGRGRTVSVRVNGLETPWWREDLAMCAEHAENLASVVVPKVESARGLDAVDDILGRNGDWALTVQALVETPLGVRSADEIATGRRVSTMILGYADLAAALGRSRTATPDRWLYVQDTLLHAARAADLQMVDGPHLAIADDAEYAEAAQWTADLGYDGKWVIHPAQIDTATRIFTPSDEDVAQARAILEVLADAGTAGSGAAQLDGQMLDEAIAVWARRVLARSAHTDPDARDTTTTGER